MTTLSEYGYKVCYRKHGRRRWKVYLVTNSYDGALWNVRWYESHSPPDQKTKEPIQQVDWDVFPIKTFLEYKWLWRGCPF